MMRMRALVPLFLVVAWSLPLEAQKMGVADFTRLKRPLWNRSKVAVDKQQALLDLITPEKGFTFKADGQQDVQADEGDGMITVRLPHKTRFVTITHPDYGQLTWRPSVKYLKRKRHYRATLLANNPEQAYKLTRQWVVMQVNPQNAIVRMDSTLHLLRDGSLTAHLPLGSHTYQVEAPFFEAVTDSFCLTDSAKTVLNVMLQPAYSYLKVITPWAGAKVYIDGRLVDSPESTSCRLMAGSHHLSVQKGGLSYYEAPFEIGSAEKRVVTLTQSDFNPWRIPAVADVQPQLPADSAAVLLTAALNAQLTEAPDSSLDERLIQLQNTEAMVNVRSNVVGARIFVNNQPAGQTPCIIEHLQPNRPHSIRLEMEGYKPVTQWVQPKGNELTDMNIKMKKRKKKQLTPQ